MKTLVALFLLATITPNVMCQVSKSGQYDLVIGTYTSKVKDNGIQVYSFNSNTGEVAFKSKVDNIDNPSFVAVSQDKKNVYSVSEIGTGKGSITAFSFDAPSGKLKLLNAVSSGGDGPCYVSVDEKKKVVFVGNYGGGTLSAAHVNSDGSLKPEIQTIVHEGTSIVKGRQDKPHVHSAVVSPDNNYLFVPDLGTDKVNIYAINASKPQPLSAGSPPFAAVKPGSGPRHFTFHPNGKFAYLVHEMEPMVTVFSYNKGKLEALQSLTMLSEGFTGKVGAADIHVSPDGKFVYASNRGEANEIVFYSIDASGKMTYAGRQSTMGNTPRNFAIDPSGNYLLAANQNSDTVVIFKRDQTTGQLTDTGKRIEISMPVCLKFVPL